MLIAAETIVRTDTGRQRRGNEDSSYARPPVFVLADGMGGAQSGEVASQMVVDAFTAGLPETGTPEERLSVVVQRANREIHERSQNEIENAGMGTTVTAAYLEDDAVAIAHVGDSRAYLLRDGELSRLTEDHSLVEELLRGGKLTEEEAFEHPQRSVITRALGVEPIVEIDTWTYPLRPGDVVLFCSDGLTDMLPEAQIQQALTEVSDLSAAAERLIYEANDAGGRDNITVVLFRVGVASEAAAETRPADDDHVRCGLPGQARLRRQRREGAGASSPTGQARPARPCPGLQAAHAGRVRAARQEGAALRPARQDRRGADSTRVRAVR